MKKSISIITLLLCSLFIYSQNTCIETNLLTKNTKKYKSQVDYYTSGNKYISEYSIFNIENIQLRRIFIKNNTETNTIEIVIREDVSIQNNGSRTISYIENERLIITTNNTSESDKIFNTNDESFILFFEDENQKYAHLHSLKINNQFVDIIDPLTESTIKNNNNLIALFVKNVEIKNKLIEQEIKIHIQDSIITYKLEQEKQLLKLRIIDSINQVLLLIAEKERIKRSINPDSIMIADKNDNIILNYTIETKLLEALKKTNWQFKYYKDNIEIIGDKNGKLKQLIIPKTENLSFKNNFTSLLNEIEITPKSIDNIIYSTRYTFPLEYSKNNYYLKCIVKSNNNIYSKFKKNLIREELSSQILTDRNKRLWKGKYKIEYTKYKVNNDSTYKVTNFKIKDVYALKIGFSVTSNYSFLPTNIDYIPLQFIIPQISILYRWIGGFYGFGINRINALPDVNYLKYPTNYQANTTKNLLKNTLYQEVGMYFQLVSCLYIKGGVTLYSGKYVYSNDIRYFNKTNFNEIGFLAGISIYPRYMHIDIGYNHTFKSIYTTIGFNIPIKI